MTTDITSREYVVGKLSDGRYVFGAEGKILGIGNVKKIENDVRQLYANKDILAPRMGDVLKNAPPAGLSESAIFPLDNIEFEDAEGLFYVLQEAIAIMTKG